MNHEEMIQSLSKNERRFEFFILLEIVEFKKKKAESFLWASCSVYSVFLILCSIWTLMNLWQHWNQLISPVSSNGFDVASFHQLIYPAITICNISPNIKILHKVRKKYQNRNA
jgi:hypothetical protein